MARNARFRELGYMQFDNLVSNTVIKDITKILEDNGYTTADMNNGNIRILWDREYSYCVKEDE